MVPYFRSAAKTKGRGIKHFLERNDGDVHLTGCTGQIPEMYLMFTGPCIILVVE